MQYLRASNLVGQENRVLLVEAPGWPGGKGATKNCAQRLKRRLLLRDPHRRPCFTRRYSSTNSRHSGSMSCAIACVRRATFSRPGSATIGCFVNNQEKFSAVRLCVDMVFPTEAVSPSCAEWHHGVPKRPTMLRDGHSLHSVRKCCNGALNLGAGDLRVCAEARISRSATRLHSHGFLLGRDALLLHQFRRGGEPVRPSLRTRNPRQAKASNGGSTINATWCYEVVHRRSMDLDPQPTDRGRRSSRERQARHH